MTNPNLQPNHGEYLRLAFSPSSAPLRTRWRNNGLSADFLGDYATTFLPADPCPKAAAQHREIRHAVSYIANELLENAMKYHVSDPEIPIEVQLELRPDRITVRVKNGVDPEQGRRYRSFADSMKNCDAGERLVWQMEQNPDDGEGPGSGLGLLTMMTDYDASLEWLFQAEADGGAMTVTTSAVLSLTGNVAAEAQDLRRNSGKVSEA